MDRTSKRVLLAVGVAMFFGIIVLLLGLLSAWDVLIYYFWNWLSSPGT